MSLKKKKETHTRHTLYVHSKLYYGIQCRKSFPSQCKWPAQYYTVENKTQYIIHRKDEKKIPLFLLLYCPLLGFLMSTLRGKKSKDPPRCSLHMYTSRTTCVCVDPTMEWRNLKYELTVWSLNFPLDDVVIPAFSHISLPMLKSSIHRLYSVLPRRRQSMCWWRRGEQHARGRVKAEEGGKGEVLRVGWGDENPLYIQWLPGWLPIWNCKSFPLSPPTVLSADSKMTTKIKK